MGLRVYVLRSAIGDCTNGGVSSGVEALTLVNVEGPFKPNDDAPAAMLDSHIDGCLRIVPDRYPRNRVGPMAGGHFAHSCDSRFSEACRALLGRRFYGAVAIHDRFETQSDYDALSR
jgi:hypothetical protein